MIHQNSTSYILYILCKEFPNQTYRTGNFPPDNFSRKYPSLQRHGPESDSGALIYIIAVLLFYSAAIIIMIIKYLKSERKDQLEDALIENFFRDMPTGKSEKENRVNQVAIHAFHTLTTAVYSDESLPSTNEVLITDV
ncbi:uncharacterized protein LOC115216824 [Argonauta hians]